MIIFYLKGKIQILSLLGNLRNQFTRNQLISKTRGRNLIKNITRIYWPPSFFVLFNTEWFGVHSNGFIRTNYKNHPTHPMLLKDSSNGPVLCSRWLDILPQCPHPVQLPHSLGLYSCLHFVLFLTFQLSHTYDVRCPVIML